ncbi:hypothetical protein [Vibrio salinus]|uniref:hypothetical protein n=1 Tax=Vibrio salinus TaxID=2899784 RepID=UPI001E61CA6A|nr:hypothetical protein [Vibrio salinus]MCE0495151.1 hypothetical protein [Vibrio salinus]
MRKKLLASSIAISCACWSLLSAPVFADTSVDQKALDAQMQRMEEMHKSYEAELLKMTQMRKEYEARLEQAKTEEATPGAMSEESYEKLKSLVDRIYFYGFFRAKYDVDDLDTDVGSGTNNRHFYLDFEAKMKVNDNWNAFFQSETRKGYTVNQSWREGDAGSSDQDGTVQRIWTEGNVHGVGVTVGTKWWGLGFQAVPFGHAADGIQFDYDVYKDWNAKAFWWRPRQGDLISMPNGQESSIYGTNLTGSITDELATSLTVAGNENHGDDQKMSRMAAAELQWKAYKDITLTGSFAWTNADTDNTSQEYRIDYKATDLDKIGSYNLYARYIDFEKYGDYSHDDEWGSLPSDTQGWIAGVKYVLFKNVVWETFYSIQRRNRSEEANGLGGHRDLFRTQIDFHF